MVSARWMLGLIAAIAQAEQMSRQSKIFVSYDTSFIPIDDIGSTLSVRPDALLQDSPLLKSTGLHRWKKIEVVIAVATVAGAGFAGILAASAGLTMYDNIAAKIKAKSDANSCTLTYGTDFDDGNLAGYAFRATTTGSNCDTTAIEKTIKDAVKGCADKLHDAGAVTGCCRFSHGGTWTGHLRLTADPKNFPATDVNC